jgi:IS30 family transposase
LALEWSPAQVAGWLKLEFPNQDTMRISHETIHRSLFIQARGVLKKELIGQLRSRRKMRRVETREHGWPAARADR